MKKFEAGFIGAGNMGGALATAAAKQVTGERVAVACSSPAHSAAAAERLGCRAAAPEEILGGSKFVFLGVKPQMIDGVVQSLAAPIAASESIFVSMLAGSAEMVLQSGKHPEQLKDEVCSPGGSTIAGVDALEQHGFRGSCIAAVDAAFEKTRQLG